MTSLLQLRQKNVDRRPTLSIEIDVDTLRSMTEHEAQQFAYFFTQH
jgi:hypothetical protein